MRWVPIETHWWELGGLFRNRVSEAEQLDLSRDLHAVAEKCALDRKKFQTLGPAITVYAERCHVLKHFVFGSKTYQSLPIDTILPDPHPIPVVDAVMPETITLRTNAGAVKPARVTLAILGSGLASVAPAGIRVSTGNAKIVETPRPLGDAILVTLDVESASQPILLELPLDPAAAAALGGRRRSIPSRPVLVTVAKD
jgi:hypothetical protein